MIFYAGLLRMSRQEKIAFLSQMHALGLRNLLLEGVRKKAFRLKEASCRMGGKVFGRFSPKAGQWCADLDQALQWEIEVINRATREESLRLNFLSDEELVGRMDDFLRGLANLKEGVAPNAKGRAVLDRASDALGIVPQKYADDGSLEAAIFEKWIEQMLGRLQESLKEMPQQEIDRLEAILREELESLSRADREKIRQALGLERLSARAVLGFLRSSSSVAILQMLTASAGFSAYLFLATILKAFSLLLGLSFSFGVYTAAMSSLAFILSAPFLFLVTSLAGGLMWWKTDRACRGNQAAMAVVVGRSRMMQEF